MHRRLPDRAGEQRQGCSESNQQKCRRQSKGYECGKRASPARTQQAETEAQLATCRARQKLTDSKQLAELIITDPATAIDHFSPEVTQMRDRPAERCQAEFQEHKEYFDRAAGFWFHFPGFIVLILFLWFQS
jgi:hypothetical protein